MCVFVHAMHVLISAHVCSYVQVLNSPVVLSKPACSEDVVASSPIGVVTGSMLTGHLRECWRSELCLTPALPTEASPGLLIVCLFSQTLLR